jgi:hypothetical protein
VVFILAAALALAGAVVSLFRGGVYIHDEQQPGTRTIDRSADRQQPRAEGDGSAGEPLDVNEPGSPAPGIAGDPGRGEPTTEASSATATSSDASQSDPSHAATAHSDSGHPDRKNTHYERT